MTYDEVRFFKNYKKGCLKIQNTTRQKNSIHFFLFKLTGSQRRILQSLLSPMPLPKGRSLITISHNKSHILLDSVHILRSNNMTFFKPCFCQSHAVNLRTKISILFFEETCFFRIIHCISKYNLISSSLLSLIIFPSFFSTI